MMKRISFIMVVMMCMGITETVNSYEFIILVDNQYTGSNKLTCILEWIYKVLIADEILISF